LGRCRAGSERARRHGGLHLPGARQDRLLPGGGQGRWRSSPGRLWG
jgi:hypothetical protein